MSVAGGSAPAPLHSTWPEPQSPVEHEPRPAGSKEHPVRPQKRPDQPVGARSERDPPAGRANPVVSSGDLPEFDSMPGHTVSPHRFTNVNVVQLTDPATTRTYVNTYRN